MKKNIGFIGCGKMAGAIIKGILESENAKNFEIIASEINEEIAKSAGKKLNIKVITNNVELVNNSDIIFIALRPSDVISALEEIKNSITPEKLVVSIAAGITTSKIEGILNAARIIRVMPNTPALVKLGMFGLCKGKNANTEDIKLINSLLFAIGKCIELDNESQMDIVTAISGSGPAFFYQVIEDMARAGEKLGLDYEKSLIAATQTALGSSQMIFNRGETSVQTLIDNVATKGGCTFVGIQEMKHARSNDLFFNVIDKTTQKAHALGQ